MNVDDLAPEVSAWLTKHGWFPGRDIGQEADTMINLRHEDAERRGYPLTIFPEARNFIHTYGSLELHLDPDDLPGYTLTLDPTIGHEGDVEEFEELSVNLGQRLFPVGYEDPDDSIVLMDEIGRFFFLHFTGAYYMGDSANDMFYRYLHKVKAPDAEDFFV